MSVPSSTSNRTTVRAGASPPPPRRAPRRAPGAPGAPWYLRASFSALGTISPPLAAAWAERLFLTPPRHGVPASEADALSQAHAGTIEAGGHTLATWTWGRGPTVLLVHGWGGRGGQLHAFVPELVAQGLSVVAFDGPGHGRSSGRTSSLVEHGRALRAVAEALPSEVVGVIAHSMGGAAATYALQQGLDVRRAVFVGTPTSADAWTHTFSAALGLQPHIEDSLRTRIEQRLHVPFAELEMSRMAPGQVTPLLVVHDEDDKEVPWKNGAATAAAWPGARLHTTRGLGHRRVLEDADVIAETVAFIASGVRLSRPLAT